MQFSHNNCRFFSTAHLQVLISGRPDALIEVKDFIKFKIAMYDRRHGERRRQDSTDFNPDEERRSGKERRKAVGS
ncbi:hypothetical protein DSCA_62860 [Desulfosarcina alkanivorans]|uniref:Uncharacterized protein n=1 Tax=Desulfosarcina alkanivorans TaxID=571177 RepID=A0A5K7YSN8_9BACT|nr:hypothetical protein DSCA_62860 [Desulfosarcina alkanivorans]